MKRFLLEIDEALALEDAGEAIIVYMDESYIHENHASEWGWFKSETDKDGKETGHYTAMNAKGRRLIIVHAITKDGAVVTRDSNGYPIEENSMKELTESLPTAEMIFKAGKATGDYHKNMDGHVFNKWLNERCKLVVDALFPNKKVFLVIDNAP